MAKCKWCGSPRAPQKSLCSSQCEKEYEKYGGDIKNFDKVESCRGWFDMVTEAITRCFTEYSVFKRKGNTEHLRDFIANSTIVKVWVGCTDNFTQEKLVKYYDQAVSTSEGASRVKPE